MRILILLGCLWAAPALAATVNGKSVSLTTSALGADAAVTQDMWQANGESNVAIGVTGTVGTLTIQCQRSTNGGTDWTNIGSSVSALGVICDDDWPNGWYRARAATCNTGCSVTVHVIASDAK